MSVEGTQQSPVKWYHYVANLLAGMALANVVPHFVNGISGHPFPSPFGNPPGLGNSSPLSNVLWGSFNLVIGYLLFKFGRVTEKRTISLVILFAGILCQAIVLSIAFAR